MSGVKTWMLFAKMVFPGFNELLSVQKNFLCFVGSREGFHKSAICVESSPVPGALCTPVQLKYKCFCQVLYIFTADIQHTALGYHIF